MTLTANNLIVECKAIESVLKNLIGYADGIDLSLKPVKDKVLRFLEIQKILKEDYNIDYSSSLLYDFTQLQEVNANGSNVQE